MLVGNDCGVSAALATVLTVIAHESVIGLGDRGRGQLSRIGDSVG